MAFLYKSKYSDWDNRIGLKTIFMSLLKMQENILVFYGI